MPFIPPIIAGVAAASASAGTIATGAAVAGAAVAGVGVGVGIGAGVFTRRDSRGSDNTEGLPVPNLAVVAPAPDWLPCDVPWSYFQKCGAEIATDGYQVETAYVDGAGYLRQVPADCMELVVTLAGKCDVDPSVVEPVRCGSNCIRYPDISAREWAWFTNLTASHLERFTRVVKPAAVEAR